MKLNTLLKQHGVQATENIINVLLGSHRAKFHLGFGFEYIDEVPFFMPYYNVIVPDPHDEIERNHLIEKVKLTTTSITEVKSVEGQLIIGCQAEEGPFVVTIDDVAYIANIFIGPEIVIKLTDLRVPKFKLEFLIDQINMPLED